MTIKLIATDMDGTFLTDDKKFDQVRFKNLMDYLKQEQIKFVSASGNQFYLLKNFFKDYPEILYVAENGALVGSQTEVYVDYPLAEDVVQKIINVLADLKNVRAVVSAEKSAYILNNVSEGFLSLTRMYYPELQLINDYGEINDNILKFSINCPYDETEAYMQKLANAIGPTVEVVSSGHGDIDVIRAGISKATGLAYLGEKFDISASEMCAFGDGGNDLAMLDYVGHGVAMGNATPIVQQTADFETLDNNQQGVIQHLEEIFQI